jgi:dihydrofolate reductase
VELLEQEKDRIYIIGATETFDSDFALMRKLLNVSPDVQLPTDEYGSHRTPEGYEKTISEEGRKNVQDYYKNDYEIYNWCVKKREELLALRGG